MKHSFSCKVFNWRQLAAAKRFGPLAVVCLFVCLLTRKYGTEEHVSNLPSSFGDYWRFDIQMANWALHLKCRVEMVGIFLDEAVINPPLEVDWTILYTI